MPHWMFNHLHLKGTNGIVHVRYGSDDHKWLLAKAATIRPLTENFFLIQNEQNINEELREAFANYKVLSLNKTIKVTLRKN